MVSLLDIIGPVMVGPSSSHTAGACRLGLIARALAGGQQTEATVEVGWRRRQPDGSLRRSAGPAEAPGYV